MLIICAFLRKISHKSACDQNLTAYLCYIFITGYHSDDADKSTLHFNSRPVPNVVLLPCQIQMNLARQWHDDSTAAVSNIEPNTVAPNSKDKTNHPSSGNIYK